MIDSIVEKIKAFIKAKIDFSFGWLEPFEYRHLKREMVMEGSVEVASSDNELMNEIFTYNKRLKTITDIKGNIRELGRMQFRLNLIMLFGVVLAASFTSFFATLPIWFMMLVINTGIHFVEKYVNRQLEGDIGYPIFAPLSVWIAFENGSKRYVNGIEME